MALLYRFSKLTDRNNTGIFTFIVTRSVTRDLHRDATTKDFFYGYHKWAISFTRANDKVLGVYLILRDTSPSATCFADFSLSLLNREHFSRNEQYSEKQCKFTSDHPAHGINKWIPLSDIQTRNFGDETGEFLLELSLGNIMTVFETEINLQTSGGPQGATAPGTVGGGSNGGGGHHPVATFKNGKIETTHLHFGSFDWNISIVTHNPNSSGAANMVRGLFKDNVNSDQELFRSVDGTVRPGRTFHVFLNRLTGFENSCRIQFRFVLGQGQFREDSGMLEQMSDMNGRSRGFQLDQHTFANLTSMGVLHLYFEFFSCNSISEVKVPIARSISPTINCYDRNKQGWCIEADLEGEYIKLKLYFMDMHSVPRNHLRYVSWFTFLSVLDPTSGQQESVPVKNSPHFSYYIQDALDMGVVISTSIPVADIKASPKRYLENESHLTVLVEWFDSIMLFNHIYHKYDDIARMHCHQMRREIQALTSENYSLERQIFAYQKSISMANNIGNMARLSISSPSKPAPSIGFGSSPGSYRTLNHLGTEGNYYNSDVSSEGYYERDNAQDMGAVDIQQQQQQLSSPQQTQQSPVVNAAQSYHQQTAHYFAANFPNTGGSGPSSARQSFSGPASPHHQSHPYHHSSQQYVNQAQQPPQQQQQQYHHHQLPAIPNKLTYSTSGYMLSSPGATSPMAAMYHQQQQQQQHLDDGTDQNGGNGNGSVADDYNPFAGQYRLKV
ncbi:hypothetical protein TYRP_012374 [Tyrophagus putrescentiae]|nr:hypothetical protein TYRP_012374 [Tyrophagus putrescentiae]